MSVPFTAHIVIWFYGRGMEAVTKMSAWIREEY